MLTCELCTKLDYADMAITAKSIKILWSAAGGRCSFPDCWGRLCYHEAEDKSPFTLGEMAHICGDRPGANRHDDSQTPEQRDDYKNLILLCPTHHTLIDRKENEIILTAEMLHEMKATHEARVLERMGQDRKSDRAKTVSDILMLLEENRQLWMQYGPTSVLARKEPHNKAAHAVWLSERLSVIVPNNRKIVQILKENKNVFERSEQKSMFLFLTHARSYETWVQDEIPYAAVVRFPKEFEIMIEEAVDASAK